MPSNIRPFVPADPVPPVDLTNLTIREAVNLYVVHDSKRLGRCQRSAHEREKLLIEFCDSFGDRPVLDCCAADLQFWMDGHTSWKSDWTLLRVLRTIQRPFNWLVDLGILQRSPFHGLSHPEGERGRPMERKEFRLLLCNTSACFRRVLIFLRFSGVRPGELRALEWDFIQFENACAVLERHKTVRTRKDRAPRVIILHPVCVKLLIWIKRQQPQGQKFVFTNSEGNPWTKSALDLRLYRLRKRLGIDTGCKLHGVRHEFATRLALSGVDVASLSAILGHTTWTMAAHYVHASGKKQHLHDAVVKGLSGESG